MKVTETMKEVAETQEHEQDRRKKYVDQSRRETADFKVDQVMIKIRVLSNAL